MHFFALFRIEISIIIMMISTSLILQNAQQHIHNWHLAVVLQNQNEYQALLRGPMDL